MVVGSGRVSDGGGCGVGGQRASRIDSTGSCAGQIAFTLGRLERANDYRLEGFDFAAAKWTAIGFEID